MTDSLVGRAVEAAARAEWDRIGFKFVLADGRHETWDDIIEYRRSRVRDAVRPAVMVVLGVVADHCTTEAIRVEAAANGVPGAMDVAAIAAKAYRDLAAELKETPE